MIGKVTVCAMGAESVTVDGTCAMTDGVTIDGACVETDGVMVEGTCAEDDSVTVDAAPLLVIGGGRGFVTLAGLRDAVESEGRSGSV